MKKFTAAVLSLCLLFLLSSCGRDDGLNIYFPIELSPRSLDPQVACDDVSKMIALNMYDCLVRIDENGQIVPAAAEKWQVSADGLTYTFTISESAKWYLTDTSKTALEEKLPEDFDKSVTADDFVFGLQRAVAPSTASADASLLSSIKNADKIISGELPEKSLGVAAKDKKTLVITLARPDGMFLYKLAHPVCAPCSRAFFDAVGGRYNMETQYSLSNGPFFMTRKNDGSYIRLSRSDEYEGPNTCIPSAVWFYVNSDADVIPSKIGKGTYEAGFVRTAEGLSDKTFNFTAIESGVKLLAFNCADSHFMCEKLRRAVSLAVKNETITNLYGEEAADGLIPDSCKKLLGGFESAPVSGADAALASELFSEALTELSQSDIELKCLCSEEDADTVKIFMQDWQEILGDKCIITADVRTKSELSAAVKNGNYEFAVCDFQPEGSDLNTIFEMFTSSGSGNFVSFRSDEYDNLIESMRSAGEGEYAALCSRCEEMLIGHSAVLPLCKTEEILVCQKEIGGIYFYGDRQMTYFNKGEKM